MQVWRCDCAREVHLGSGAGGLLLQRSLPECADELLSRFGGQVQTIYLDPPFNTGERFAMKMRVGEAEWRSSRARLTLPAYDDRWPSEAAYLEMMRGALTLAHGLLREDGTIFLHIDARMHAHLRLMMDEIFGAEHFLNEIIWAYQTGGRALRHFSRKHDIILFYAKSRKYFFNIRAVPVPRAENRSNHMRRCVDADGRTYRTIRSGGREYIYYDDEPAYPGDVWDDVSHLQQKDPQRTGYDTQKPFKLLERIVLCASRPGDLVCDLFCGSGTTLDAAARSGRRFLGVDRSLAAQTVSRKRLLGCRMELEAPPSDVAARVFASMAVGIGFYTVHLDGYEIEPERGRFEGLDAVDQWSAGFLRGDAFHPYANAARSKQRPRLPDALEIPVLSGTPCLETVDVFGRRAYHCFAQPGR